MSVGQWSSFYLYTSSNVDIYVGEKAGNYRLCTKSGNDYYAFYAGKSDTDLKRRLKEHLSVYETNTCIKNKLKNNTCYFQYVYVSTQIERDQIESDDIRKYTPVCNTQQP